LNARQSYNGLGKLIVINEDQVASKFWTRKPEKGDSAHDRRPDVGASIRVMHRLDMLSTYKTTQLRGKGGEKKG